MGKKQYSAVKLFQVFLFIAVVLSSCTSKPANPSLQLSHEEIVHALINLYTVNAALDINDVLYRDSTRQEYYRQLAGISDKPMEVIRSNIDKLLLMPDTFLLLQNMALDSLRKMQEKGVTRPGSVNIKIN